LLVAKLLDASHCVSYAKNMSYHREKKSQLQRMSFTKIVIRKIRKEFIT